MVCTGHDHGFDYFLSSHIISLNYMRCQRYWTKIVKRLEGRDFLGTNMIIGVFHKVGTFCKLRES